jgi:hypothetical protein
MDTAGAVDWALIMAVAAKSAMLERLSILRYGNGRVDDEEHSG